MGSHRYDSDARNFRTQTFYSHAATDQIFEQQKSQTVHDHMSPKNVLMREARDSEVHPKSFPVIIVMDETGSMGKVPEHLIREGLPKIVAKLIAAGCPDPAILFVAVGDHLSDGYPLQVGQFESGDEQLDMWLSRTYLEGNGGGNGGESYALGYYFAAYHTVTDAWEKRKKKGVLITIGDDKCHSLPQSAINHIMGDSAQTAPETPAALLAEAQKRYDVFHLHVMQGGTARNSVEFWRELLGNNCKEVQNFEGIPEVIAGVILTSFAEQITENPPIDLRPPNEIGTLW